jgi:hypothetical protein
VGRAVRGQVGVCIYASCVCVCKSCALFEHGEAVRAVVCVCSRYLGCSSGWVCRVVCDRHVEIVFICMGGAEDDTRKLLDAALLTGVCRGVEHAPQCARSMFHTHTRAHPTVWRLPGV